MERSRFLLGIGVDANAWAVRHGIEPFSHGCSDCGAPLRTSLPFAYRSLRGLVAPRCACGNERTPYCVVRVDGDLFTDSRGKTSSSLADRRSSGPRHRLLRLVHKPTS